MENGHRLYTVKELAAYLRVSRSTAYRLPIPYVTVGADRRYRAEAVEAYLNDPSRSTRGFRGRP